MSHAVIAAYVRTPYHFAHKGALIEMRPDDLAAATLKAIIGQRLVRALHHRAMAQQCGGQALVQALWAPNLAQAVAITAYEWRMTLAAAPPAIFGDAPEPASAEAMQGLYDHFERELEAAGFFHPPEKKPSMVQNLRSALGRARFSDQEVRTFRGVVTALSRGRGRVLAKLAEKAKTPPNS